MIIECRNCLKKFIVEDKDIPVEGRMVKCSNCGSQWKQKRFSSEKVVDTSVNKNQIEEDISKDEPVTENLQKDNFADKVEASDGNTYKFLGNQWAMILPSGKFGRLAKKNISEELNKLSGRKTKKIIQQKKVKKDSLDPEQKYQEKENGMGLFSLLIVLFMAFAAIILFLDTFKNLIIPFWPDLDKYLIYFFETVNNIYIIIKDLINNYK